MYKVVADISMSLDGFVTGPNPDLEHGLGVGGEVLHTWAFSGDGVDSKVLREGTESTGAVVMGRNLFDFVDGPNGWSEQVGYGAGLAAMPKLFVVTHEPPESVHLERDITFVTAGPEAAIHLAQEVAGDKDVVVMGGGNLIRQVLVAGLADELRIHLAPVALGGGTPLFEGGERLHLNQEAVQVSPDATHLTYRVLRGTQPHSS
ncbi:MAG: dihydrofolate reductase family protein [Anaerolineales bacterium]|jgi:dihydrofolate reductase